MTPATPRGLGLDPRPADREVLTGALAEFALAQIRPASSRARTAGSTTTSCFVGPWGFDVASIRVPVLVRHGEQDRFVPVAHGRWLAEHIPGAEARIEAEDGHLTIGERRIPDVHAWLLERF